MEQDFVLEYSGYCTQGMLLNVPDILCLGMLLNTAKYVQQEFVLKYSGYCTLGILFNVADIVSRNAD